MLHRIRKKHDENHGKWIGVGGKFEQGESPEECMRRETREETGLLIDRYRYCGIVTFQNDDAETEFMHLFLVTEFHSAEGPEAGAASASGNSIVQPDKDQSLSKPGLCCVPEERPKESRGEKDPAMFPEPFCDEGDLAWLPIRQLTRIPHWAGDRIFLSLIFAEPAVPFFSLKLVYRTGILTEAVLNEHGCLVTENLILRPLMERDAGALSGSQQNGPEPAPAGEREDRVWPPFGSREEALSAIRGELGRPDVWAVVLRDTSEPAGLAYLHPLRIEGAVQLTEDLRREAAEALNSAQMLPGT